MPLLSAMEASQKQLFSTTLSAWMVLSSWLKVTLAPFSASTMLFLKLMKQVRALLPPNRTVELSSPLT